MSYRPPASGDSRPRIAARAFLHYLAANVAAASGDGAEARGAVPYHQDRSLLRRAPWLHESVRASKDAQEKDADGCTCSVRKLVARATATVLRRSVVR